MKLSVFAFLGLVANLATAIELTVDNYDEVTAGKTVFLKMFAPWCGHCKKMKPDWDKLMEEFKDADGKLVGDVDCTSDGGKPLCDANGVRGYPTLKWGDPAGLEDYSGGRDYDSLKKFAEENLKPICSPSNMDLCGDDEKAEIEKYLALGAEGLEKEVEAKKGELEKIEADFKAFISGLQDQYSDATKKKEEDVAKVKASGLSLMQKCLASLKQEKRDEL